MNCPRVLIVIGSLDVGKAADVLVWPIEHPAELSYWMGGLKPDALIRGGQLQS